MIDTILSVLLGYLACGLLVLLWSAYESASEFCRFKIQHPEQPIQIQFANLYYQMLSWPAVLMVKFVQWRYMDRMVESAQNYNQRNR